eukprot:5400731-Prorocentrum_lima.AAC.1
MTSSLVGSEMCIRDRSSLVITAAGLHITAVEPAAQLISESHEEALRLIAVSYTHLTLPTICSV